MRPARTDRNRVRPRPTDSRGSRVARPGGHTYRWPGLRHAGLARLEGTADESGDLSGENNLLPAEILFRSGDLVGVPRNSVDHLEVHSAETVSPRSGRVADSFSSRRSAAVYCESDPRADSNG